MNGNSYGNTFEKDLSKRHFASQNLQISQIKFVIIK